MRNVVRYVRVTLDGFFQGSRRWDLDFFGAASGPEYGAFCVEMERKAGGLLLGRRTYEGFAGYWPTARGPEAPRMNGLTKHVFSRSLARADWNRTVLERERPEVVVPRLKRRPGGDLFIFGSGELAACLQGHGLIDEYWFSVVPVLLGRGRPAFARSTDRLNLALRDARSFKDGGLILRYRVRAARRPDGQ